MENNLNFKHDLYSFFGDHNIHRTIVTPLTYVSLYVT